MANTNTKTSTLNSNSKSSEKETKVTELSSVQKLKYFIGMYNIKGDTGSSSKDTKCVSPSDGNLMERNCLLLVDMIMSV